MKDNNNITADELIVEVGVSGTFIEGAECWAEVEIGGGKSFSRSPVHPTRTGVYRLGLRQLLESRVFRGCGTLRRIDFLPGVKRLKQ